MREDVIATTRVIWYSALGILVVGAAVALVAYAAPWRLEREREAQEQSRQFVTTKRDLLLLLAAEYETCKTDIARYEATDPVKFKQVVAGLETQADAVLTRLRAEAKSVPAGDVPAAVRKYLN